MDRFLEIIGNQGVSNIIIVVITTIAGIILKLHSVKKYQLERAVLALQTGVLETYQVYVKSIKEGSEDGKLNDSEKQEAREQAYIRAKQILEKEGISLAKLYGPRVAGTIIDAIVKESKAEGGYVKKEEKAVMKNIAPLLLMMCLLFGGGCLYREPPAEVKQATVTRSQALDSYAKNTQVILAEIISAYVASEERHARHLYNQDVIKFKNLAGPISAVDAADTMQGIQTRYEANMKKIEDAARGLRDAAVKAQADLTIVLKLQAIIDKYHQAGMNIDDIQPSIDPILEILKDKLKGKSDG